MQITSYKKKDGKTYYMFQAYVGMDPLTGKQKQTTRRGFKTQKEAQIAYARLLNGVKEKKNPASFREVYDLWLDQYKNTVRESTLVKTKQHFVNHILPSIGHLRIQAIDLSMMQRVVNEWAEKTQSFSAIKNYASSVFRHAMRLGLLDKNPCDLLVLPRKNAKKRFTNYLDREELLQLLRHIEQTLSPLWVMFFHLVAYTGIRKGEALALTWGDVDLDQQTIRIDKTVTKGENGAIINEAKTESGIRTISLDDGTVSRLAAWKEQSESDLVFPSKRGKHITYTRPRKELNRVIKAFGLKPLTTHGLRHSHCCLLFEAGASIAQVQSRLGHADAKITLSIYNHVTKKKETESAELFANYLSQKS